MSTANIPLTPVSHEPSVEAKAFSMSFNRFQTNDGRICLARVFIAAAASFFFGKLGEIMVASAVMQRSGRLDDVHRSKQHRQRTLEAALKSLFRSPLGLPSPQKRDLFQCFDEVRISCDYYAPSSAPGFRSRWCSWIEFGQVKLAH
jgi:hypothetical protein